MAGQVPGGGYRQAAPAEPAGPLVPPVSICGACGVSAPARSTACEACKASLSETKRQVAVTLPIVWCSIRATFRCRSCAFHSPLDGVELDRGVHCAQCGAFQKFEPEGWQAMLALAHEVADLGGPTPEGLFTNPRIWIGEDNPHRELGVTSAFATGGGGEGPTGGALPEIEVGRGFPVCRSCKQPLEVRVLEGACETRCHGCGATARYQIAPEASGWAPAMRAVVSAEQRVDQRRCRLQQAAGGGVIALLCPQCGAPLKEVRAGSVRCSHCNTNAFVPARARPRDDGSLVEADPFFVAFEGPSLARVQLEAPKLPAGEVGGSVKGLFVRGLRPLPGVELPEKKLGLDLRQLALSLGLTTLAVVVGLFVVAFFNHVIAGAF